MLQTTANRAETQVMIRRSMYRYGVAFFLFCWMLHTRDRKAAAMRAAWDPAKAG